MTKYWRARALDMLSDRILMLSLISKGSKEGWLGITKLQKLSFLTEYSLSLQNKRGFSYEFFNYDLGPMSKGVYDDFQFLLDEELIIEDESGIRPSGLGRRVIEQFQDLIPKNINTIMYDICEKYASMRTKKLVDTVHRMKVRLPDGTVNCIDELEKNTTILPEPSRTNLNIGKEYIETFNILREKHLIKLIRETRKKGSRSKPYVPLISSSS